MDDTTVEQYIELIDQWGIDRNITAQGGATVMSQMSKMMEEFAEFLLTWEALTHVHDAKECEALYHQLNDDFGDMMVCMLNAMRLAKTDAKTCLAQSWHGSPGVPGIKDRKGRMVNGKFVKEGN